jgi:hypothetical protein
MAQSQKTPPKSNSDSAAQSESDKQADASAAYEVYLSSAAASAYEAFYKRAADAKERHEITSSHFTALHMIDEALGKIIPRDPFNKTYALQGTLSGIFRLQKGRLRICWMGNSQLRRVCVIFISETLRKAGDVNDPYRILTSMLMSGEFSQVFEELGLKSHVQAHLKRQKSLPN